MYGAELGTSVLADFGIGQPRFWPSTSLDCSAALVDYLAIVASNTTSSLEKEAFKKNTSLPRTPVLKPRKEASQIGQSLHSWVTTYNREMSKDLILDPFSRSSTILRSPAKLTLLKEGNQGIINTEVTSAKTKQKNSVGIRTNHRLPHSEEK